MIEYQRQLVTAALPYANGPLHVGHLCGAYLPADIYVRFQRSMGKDVVFICGSDEHGAAITMRALKEGKTPRQIIDYYHALFQETFSRIGISFDYYHRTSSPLHHETSQAFFLELFQKGQFIEQESEQYYDEESKQFLADRYISGTCPKCGHPGAYGDQCESCGSSLSPTELLSPKSVLTQSVPILKKTKHWYFPLNQHEAWLKEWLNTGLLDGQPHHDPDQWKSHVLGQCNAWIDGGLQARAMTRDLDWGVDVPAQIAGHEGKKLYVWLDAPIGYISASKQWAVEHGKNWKDYWQDETCELIHFIGKDNIVFHCIIFPALLKAHGGYNLPTNVPANQFMNLEGNKISTSRNWAVWVHEFLEELPGMEDSLRYYLCKNMPEQKDSEFTWKGLQEAHNNELVNNLSNFVNRVLVLCHKYYKGIVPAFDPDQPITGVVANELGGFHDAEMLYLFDEIQSLSQSIRDFNFREALKKLMDISSAGNTLLQNNEPWKWYKQDPEMVKAVLNLCLQYVTALSVCMHPFMPFTSKRLRHMLALPEINGQGECVQMLDTLADGLALLLEGHKINSPSYLFSRMEDAVIEKQINKLKSIAMDKPEPNAKEYSPLKDPISMEDFSKLDLRTARIVAADKVENADKLLKLTLDLGFEQRTVVSGIAEHFTPDQVIGQSVLLVANLAPRKLRGIVSQGMILMAENNEGKLRFVNVADDCPSGAIVK